MSCFFPTDTLALREKPSNVISEKQPLLIDMATAAPNEKLPQRQGRKKGWLQSLTKRILPARAFTERTLPQDSTSLDALEASGRSVDSAWTSEGLSSFDRKLRGQYRKEARAASEMPKRPIGGNNVDLEECVKIYFHSTHQLRIGGDTPRARTMLKHIQWTSYAAIEDPTESKRLAVAALEKAYDSGAFVRKPTTTTEQALRSNISVLQGQLRDSERTRVLSAYGDYMANFLTDMRRNCKDPKNGYIASIERPELTVDLSVYWTDVNDRLTAEEKGERPDKRTLDSLMSVADALKLPYTYIRQLVRLYADRNTLVHNDVRHFIDTRDWPKPGKALYADSIGLQTPLLGGLTSEEHEALQYVVDGVKSKYFDSIGPLDDDVKVNTKTHEDDLEQTFERDWNNYVNQGLTPEPRYMRVAWMDKWSAEDVKILVTKCEERLRKAERNEANRQAHMELEPIEADNSKAKRKAASRQITVQDGDTDVLNSNEDEAGVGSLFHIGSSED